MSLDPAEWERIKSLKVQPRFVFHSKRARMVAADAAWPNGPQVPWIEPHGRTAQRSGSEKQYIKWRKTRSNLKWIQHLMEMKSV